MGLQNKEDIIDKLKSKSQVDFIQNYPRNTRTE